jgi:hypothetical protein
VLDPSRVQEILDQTLHALPGAMHHLELLPLDRLLSRCRDIEQQRAPHVQGVQRIPQVVRDHGQNLLTDASRSFGRSSLSRESNRPRLAQS